jgi:hypothetical protein
LDFLAFTTAAVDGVQPQYADTHTRAVWRQNLAAEYNNWTAEWRNQIADMPRILAGLLAKWPTLTDAERSSYIRLWSEQLSALGVAQPPAGAESPPATPERWSDSAPNTVEGMLLQMMQRQEEEERHLAATNPELARLKHSQNAAANAKLLSDIMQTKHEAAMFIIKNIGS